MYIESVWNTERCTSNSHGRGFLATQVSHHNGGGGYSSGEVQGAGAAAQDDVGPTASAGMDREMCANIHRHWRNEMGRGGGNSSSLLLPENGRGF